MLKRVCLCYRFGLVSGLASWSRLRGNNDDDWIDRINHLWTVVLLTMFTVVVSSAQYVGEPIHCWCPATFTSAYISYTKHICWVSNTYYLPMNDVIPIDIRERQDREITYYQWVPIIFLFMALMFKIPNFVWRVFNSGAGLNMEKIATLAESTQMGSPDEREVTIKHIASYLDKWLRAHRQYHYNIIVRVRQRLSGVCCWWFGKRDGTYLTGFYLFVKLLYCVNIIGQFFLLNAFLSIDYNLYGFNVIERLMTEGSWKESPRFPRVTLCDFEIRQLQNLQRWTVQCVLPINLFNEKIFIFIWFWLFLIGVLTCCNYVSWLYHIIFKQNRVKYIKKYLRMNDDLRTGADLKLCKKFANEYLRDDGVFVLRVIQKNSTDLALKDLLFHLWRLFKDTPYTTKPATHAVEMNHKEKGEEDESFA